MAEKIGSDRLPHAGGAAIGSVARRPIPVAGRRNKDTDKNFNDGLDDVRARFRKLGLRLSGAAIESLLENYRGRGTLLDAFI